MYTAKPGTNVVWNVPTSLIFAGLMAYKTLRIPVIGQLHCKNSAVGIAEVK